MVPDLIFQDVIILIYVKNFTLNKKKWQIDRFISWSSERIISKMSLLWFIEKVLQQIIIRTIYGIWNGTTHSLSNGKQRLRWKRSPLYTINQG